MRMRWLLAVAALGIGLAGEAAAQIQLPGAFGANPAAGPGAPGPLPLPLPGADPNKPHSPEAAPVHAPGEETISGGQFQRNGANGLMVFDKGKSLEISRLALVGENMDRSYEVCRVEISGGKIPVKPAPPAEGLVSFNVDMEACPFSVDVLDGAVRVRGKVCEIKAANCRVDPTGIWGPSGSSISGEEAKNVERLRALYETDARNLYRALVASAGNDKAKTRQIAADQAGFSSRREVMCRDYAGEDRHGFCASRVTLARAVALSAELLGGPKPAAPPKPRKPPPPKPVAAPLPPPGIQ